MHHSAERCLQFFSGVSGQETTHVSVEIFSSFHQGWWLYQKKAHIGHLLLPSSLSSSVKFPCSTVMYIFFIFYCPSTDIPQQSWPASSGTPTQTVCPRNLSKAIALNTCLSWAVGLFTCSPFPQMDIRHIFWMTPSCILYLVLSVVFSPAILSHWWDPPVALVEPLALVTSHWLFPCSAPGEHCPVNTPGSCLPAPQL